MIYAEFFKSQGMLRGFEISGHSGYAESGRDIVCAAVSSVIQFTMNLLNDLGAEPEIFIDENQIKCSAVKTSSVSKTILKDLIEHLESVEDEFPNTIKITISEV